MRNSINSSSSSLDPISILSSKDMASPNKPHSRPSQTRSIVLEEPPNTQTSPWRIRVTVDSEAHSHSRTPLRLPYINRQIRTTTRVPLKEPGPESPAVPTTPLNVSSPSRRRPTPPPPPSASQNVPPSDTTIMESEEFSIVSVASLDTHRTASSQLHKTIAQTLIDLQPDSSSIAKSPSVPAAVTPYPQRPPAQRPTPLHVDTPLRNSVVRSGRVLQDIVRTPDHTRSNSADRSTNSHLPTPDLSSSPCDSFSHARLADPMSWVATGPPRLASPMSPPSHSLHDHHNQHSPAHDAPDIWQAEASRSTDAERVDSVEPDTRTQSHNLRSIVDDTGIFWKAPTDPHTGLHSEPSILSELPHPNSPFTDCDESSLLQGTVLDTPAPRRSNHPRHETIPEESLDSVGQQLRDEALQHQTRDSPNELGLSSPVEPSTTHSRCDSDSSPSPSIDLSQPRRIPVNFGDYADQSCLPLPDQDYPHLFDHTIPHLTPRKSVSFADTTSQDSMTETRSMISRAWSAITSISAATSSECEEPSPASHPKFGMEYTTLGLRRKYGLHSNKQPFTYAHIRTLHRMLNSVRHHAHATIIPTTGPLSPSLSSALKAHSVLKPLHLYTVQAFMLLLVPVSEISHFHRRGEWGDDETKRSRGRDSKSRHGSRAVFGSDPDPLAHESGDLIRREWVVDVVVGILEKEACDLRAGKKGGGTVKVIMPADTDSPLARE